MLMNNKYVIIYTMNTISGEGGQSEFLAVSMETRRILGDVFPDEWFPVPAPGGGEMERLERHDLEQGMQWELTRREGVVTKVAEQDIIMDAGGEIRSFTFGADGMQRSVIPAGKITDSFINDAIREAGRSIEEMDGAEKLRVLIEIVDRMRHAGMELIKLEMDLTREPVSPADQRALIERIESSQPGPIVETFGGSS